MYNPWNKLPQLWFSKLLCRSAEVCPMQLVSVPEPVCVFELSALTLIADSSVSGLPLCSNYSYTNSLTNKIRVWLDPVLYRLRIVTFAKYSSESDDPFSSHSQPKWNCNCISLRRCPPSGLLPASWISSLPFWGFTTCERKYTSFPVLAQG